MPTRNVVLTDHLAEVVDRLVASGRYQNASEVIRAGLRLVEEEEAEWQTFLDRVNAGYDEAKRGEFAEGSFEEIMERIERAARGGEAA